MLPFGAQRHALTLRQGGSDLYRLFANGEDGFLFGNFGDLTRLFTTSQGLVQVANDGDSVGLALEDSDWQRRTLAAQLAQASDVLGGTGSFASATGWLVDGSTGVSGGKLNLTNSGFATYAGASLVQNAWYRCSFTIDSLTLGSASGISMRPGNNPGAVYTTPGTYTEYIQYTGATGAFDVSIVSRGGFPVGAAVIDNFTVVPVAGNHGSQASGAARPFYKPNSGKPYLLFDGSDDTLRTPFLPPAALTMAVAFNSATGNAALIGGGDSATNRRAFMGLNSLGYLGGGWGTHSFANIVATAGVDIRNSDRVGLMTADANSVDLYLDGALVYSGAPSGSPSGNTSPIALGCINNGGTPASFSAMRDYAALALNRRVTPAEIALITSRFRSTYQ
jgi:hypothetical protein